MQSKQLWELYQVTCDYLTKNASKFMNFVVNVINMFKPGGVVINSNPPKYLQQFTCLRVTLPSLYFNFTMSFIVTNTKH